MGIVQPAGHAGAGRMVRGHGCRFRAREWKLQRVSVQNLDQFARSRGRVQNLWRPLRDLSKLDKGLVYFIWGGVSWKKRLLWWLGRCFSG